MRLPRSTSQSESSRKVFEVKYLEVVGNTQRGYLEEDTSGNF
jgi:hypothetical protein